MATEAPAGRIRTTLVDISNCIGCRSCQVACKQWNDKDGEATELLPDLGFQNPVVLSAKTLTLISSHHVPDELYDRMREHFTEAELVGLTFAVIAINGWNRLAIPFRADVGSYQPGTAEAAAAALTSA